MIYYPILALNITDECGGNYIWLTAKVPWGKPCNLVYNFLIKLVMQCLQFFNQIVD